MSAMGTVGPESRRTLEAVERSNAAYNRHDIDGVMAEMTDGCVFGNTCPPPDGERFEGAAEDVFAAGNRCVVRWRYDRVGEDGVPGHIRGLDLFRVRNGKVAEKLAYVKG